MDQRERSPSGSRRHRRLNADLGPSYRSTRSDYPGFSPVPAFSGLSPGDPSHPAGHTPTPGLRPYSAGCSEFSMGRLAPTQEPPHEVATEAEDQHLPGLAQGPAPITRTPHRWAMIAITLTFGSILLRF